MRRLVVVFWLLVAMISPAAKMFGQAQNTGSILGSVTDPSGAVIPGALVVATEPTKGFTRTVTSSGSGEYLLPALPVGGYVLTVTAPGFEKFVANGIAVDAGLSVKIVAKLTVGDAGVSVNVDEVGSTLDTNSAQLGALIDNKMVEDLPIDGRNVIALTSLLPGVTDVTAPTSNTNDKQGGTFSVSGSRNTQNLQLFDGLMWNNLFLNTGIQYPPPNGLQEISVLLNNFKAQYGRNAGSVVNVITKQGGNQIHGAVWEYLQNQMFNASDYISQRNPKDNTHLFGFTVGGPIMRDKLFYQVTYQGIRQSLQNVGITPTQSYADRGYVNGSPAATDPTKGPDRPCATAGPVYSTPYCADFQDVVIAPSATGVPTAGKFYNPYNYSSSSGLQASSADAANMFASAAAQNPGVNPFTMVDVSKCESDLAIGAQYAASHNYLDGKSQPAYLPNAEVPITCLNPQIQAVLKMYVGFPTTVSANGQANNISVAPLPRQEHNVTGRVDYHLGKHQIDARYNLILSTAKIAYGVNSASLGVSTYEPSADYALSNFGNIGDTWVISPNALNTVRLGYKRYVYQSPPTDNTTWNSPSIGGNFMETGSPVLPVLNASNEYKLGTTSQANATVTNENIEALEQFQYIWGKHSFQAGVNYLRLQYLNRTDYPGTLSFSSTFTGYSFADEAMGLLTSVQANSPLVQGGIQNDIFSYVQDDWRVSSRLTLNLGVRYELPFQWYQPNGYASTFVAGHQSTRFPNAIGGLAFPGDTGILKSLVPTDFNGIVPRFGLAYDMFGNGKLALRAGFGMFFDAINANVIGVGEPFYFQFFKQLPPGGASVPLAQYGSNSADTRPNGNVLAVPAGYTPNNPQFVAPYSIFYPDRNFRTPYYEAGNFGFEAKVTKTGVLDVNYVLKLGRKQTISVDQNPAITDCSGGYYQANPALYANPSCPFLVPGSVAGGASSATSSTQQRLRYTPFNYGGGGLVDFESAATSNYNSLQALYSQRGGKRLTLQMAYTYSKSIDLQTANPGQTNSIPDVFNIKSERGLSDYNAKHVFSLGWVLTAPTQHTGFGLLDQAISNWNFGGTFYAHTGRPFNLTINNDSALDGEPNQRPALLPGANPYLPSNRHRVAKLQEYFNVDAFTYPTVGTFSSVPRNYLIGPGYLLTNMDLQRYFPLTRIREGMRLGFRADAFNVFNTPNLTNPKAQFSCTTTSIQTPGNANFGLPCRNTTVGGTLNNTFGVIQSTYGTNGNTATNGRKMQFSATVYF